MPATEALGPDLFERLLGALQLSGPGGGSPRDGLALPLDRLTSTWAHLPGLGPDDPVQTSVLCWGMPPLPAHVPGGCPVAWLDAAEQRLRAFEPRLQDWRHVPQLAVAPSRVASVPGLLCCFEARWHPACQAPGPVAAPGWSGLWHFDGERAGWHLPDGLPAGLPHGGPHRAPAT